MITHSTKKYAFPTPDNYRIRIQGALDPRWADSLGGMSIATDRISGTETVTTLSGPLPDQAALLGVLNFLYDLRCSLLLVERVNGLEDIYKVEKLP